MRSDLLLFKVDSFLHRPYQHLFWRFLLFALIHLNAADSPHAHQTQHPFPQNRPQNINLISMHPLHRTLGSSHLDKCPTETLPFGAAGSPLAMIVCVKFKYNNAGKAKISRVS